MVSQEENFSFFNILFNNSKLVILINKRLICVGCFNIQSSNSYCKLLLLHIYTAMLNYLNFIKRRKTISNSNYYNPTILNEIFSNIYYKYLIINFNQNFFNVILSNEPIIPNLRFNNIYIIDLERKKYLFNLRKIKNKQKKNNLPKKIIAFTLSLAKEIEKVYRKENDNYGIDINEIDEYFITFEMLSTYPRMIFIIKFLPVLQGIAIIHVFIQKKLSKSSCEIDIIKDEYNLNKPKRETNEKYREINVAYSRKVKNQQNKHLRYFQPKILKEIEQLFFEFTVLNDDNFDRNIYYSSDYECKYFNKDFNNEIELTLEKEMKKGTKAIGEIIKAIKNKFKNIKPKLETSQSEEFSTFCTTGNQNPLKKESIIKIINSVQETQIAYNKYNQKETKMNLKNNNNNNFSNNQNNKSISLTKVEDCTNFQVNDSMSKVSSIENREDISHTESILLIKLIDSKDKKRGNISKNDQQKKSNLKVSEMDTERIENHPPLKKTTFNNRLIRNNPQQKLVFEKNFLGNTSSKNNIPISRDLEDDSENGQKVLLLKKDNKGGTKG